MRRQIAQLLRSSIGRLVYRKRLPADFGHQPIYVSARADMRLLYPGFDRAGGDLLAIVRNHVRPGAVVWDVGSNLGILSFAAAVRAGATGRIYSIEADPRYAELQSRSARLLPQHCAPVSVLCAAAADAVGLLELVVSKRGHARNHLSIVAGNDSGEDECRKSVIAVSLDWLLERWPRPDLVKIDVEGAELLALAGASRLLSQVRPVVYIESSDANRDQVSSVLSGHGYRFFQLGAGGSEAPIDHCEFNTLAVPSVAS